MKGTNLKYLIMVTMVEIPDFVYYQYIDKNVCLLAFSLSGLIAQVKTIYNINLLIFLN